MEIFDKEKIESKKEYIKKIQESLLRKETIQTNFAGTFTELVCILSESNIEPLRAMEFIKLLRKSMINESAEYYDNKHFIVIM